MKDIQRRKRVMARSIALGHCVCNPAKPCPCDTLREHDVCPCAGEKVPAPPGQVRLTRLTDSPGCASKIDAATLRRVLGGLTFRDDPRVLVGAPAGDDAGVYLLDPHTALVQTVDVFAPSVDDPYTFGQIAAANSLSDVYAMGGRPISALSIIGLPIHDLPEEVFRDILRGGMDKMDEAGVPILGGHSINDLQVKAGFAVTGIVDPAKIITNAGVWPGDRLILTKPLGTGVLAFAAQIDRAPAGSMEAAAASMAMLNRRAAELMIEVGVRAATDVTGFGLAGHLGAMAAASGVDIEIVWDDLPLLPGVLECAAAGILPGAIERNREASAAAVVPDAAIPPNLMDLLYDPQTSGGLLIAVSEESAADLLGRLHAAGITQAAAIGRAIGPGPGRIHVRYQGKRSFPSAPASREADNSSAEPETSTMSDCCGGHGGQAEPAVPTGEASNIQLKFQEFLKAAAAPGALDARTKRAISIALSVLAKCEPCAKIHIKKARDGGFTQEEIDEAAWLAVSFGGCGAMMFYNGVRES